jgi:c-di-GMP-binding flagellar brake protein YcgR
MDLIGAIKELTLGPNFFKATLKEKRQIPRMTCHIKASAIIDGKRLIFWITDLSLRGLKVESAARLARNLVYDLRVETESGTLSDGAFARDTLRVKVAWCRKHPHGIKYSAGLLFVDPEELLRESWVYYIFNEIGFGEDSGYRKRTSLRITSDFPFECTTRDGRVLSGNLQNLSIGGVLANCGEEIPQGTIVSLSIGPYQTFRKISCRGKVVRTSFIERTYQYLLGIEFVEMAARDFKHLGKMILSIVKER